MIQRLKRFFSGKKRWIFLYFVQFGFITLLFSLQFVTHNVGFQLVKEVLGYGFLLSLGLLLVFLGFMWFFWVPLDRRYQYLLYHSEELEDFLGENVAMAERELLFKRFYRIAKTQFHQLEEVIGQQIDFLQLWIHEMKTPLAALDLDLQRMSSGTLEVEAGIRSIAEERDKLQRGLDFALQQARVANIQQDFLIEETDLEEILREKIQLRKKDWIRNRIYPKLQVDSPQIVFTDRKWLGFVIDQLLDNALKYTRMSLANEQSVELKLEIHQTGEESILSIQDYGPGIPKADLPRIFEAFYTGKNGRKFGHASGMGLYLVRKILDHLQHSILIDSEEGKGTKVTLHFPKQSLTKMKELM